MADKQSYIFDVDADISKAEQNLQKIVRLMETIESLRNKGQDDYFTTSQKDMDKNMRSMKQIAKLQEQMRKTANDFRNKSNMKIPKGASEAEANAIKKQKAQYREYARDVIAQSRAIEAAYKKTLMSFREMSNYQQNYSKNFKHLFSSNDVRNLPGGAQNRDRARRIVQSMANDTDGGKLGSIVDELKEVQRVNRRAESISRRGAAANYLSTQQAASFKKDYKTVNTNHVEQRAANTEELIDLGTRRSELHSQVKAIEQNPMASQYDVDKKIAMQGEIQAIDKEWEARMELNKALTQSIQNMKSYNQNLQGVEQKPERGTFRGMAYERAPAIGLALTGAVTGAVMSLYNKGAGFSRAMRPDEILLGQGTDTKGSLWRSNIRNGALESGLKDRLGFSGQEMLGFQSNYLANNGMTNMKDLNSAMMNQAKFSRTTGLSSNDTNDFFSTMFQTGAVRSNQIKIIQNGIIGAMKRNGMEGRTKEQVKALQSLVSGVAQGRTLSNKDVNNVMGLQSTFASSGLRSLQGQQGADLLNGMNQGIRNGFNDPTTRLVFGQGTKYQGLAGRFALRKQMDKGISDISNVSNIAKFASSYGGNNNAAQNEAFASFVQEKLGTNITGEQAQAIMDQYRAGKLTQGSLDKTLKADQATGSKESAKKLKNYQDSNAATDNQSDATTQKQATELYDLGEVVRKVNGAMGGMPPALYAAIIALTAFTVAVAGSAASFGLGRGTRLLFRQKFTNDAAGAATKTGLGTKFKNLFTGKGWNGNKGGPTPPTGGNPAPGEYTQTRSGLWVPNNGTAAEGSTGAAPNVPPNVPPTGGNAAEATPGRVGAAMEQGRLGYNIANGAEDVAGATATTSKLGSIFNAGKNILGKVMLPLAIAGGAYDVATAEKGHKGEATGRAIGSIAGGIGGTMASAGAGAAAGAAVGSIIPVGGTIVGGLVGGAIGLGAGLIGSHFGGGVGGWIGKQFDPKDTSSADKSKGKSQNESKKQQDKQNTDTKYRTEYKKTDNLQYERQNLKMEDDLLTKMQQILLQARQQNGIIGTLTGVMSVGSNSGTAKGGANTTNATGNQAEIWNYFAKQGYSNSAIAGIVGNIGTETGGTFDPTTPQQNGGPGRGLAQWTNTGRWQNLLKYAKQTGQDPNAMQTQLQFMQQEMKQMGLTPEAMNGMSVGQATSTFEQKYEGAGIPNMTSRNNYANQAYSQFGNAQLANGASSSSSSNNNVNVNGQVNVNVNGGNVAQQVANSTELQSIGQAVQQAIFGGLNYYSKEMKMN